jgi:hypothetical protein
LSLRPFSAAFSHIRQIRCIYNCLNQAYLKHAYRTSSDKHVSENAGQVSREGDPESQARRLAPHFPNNTNLIALPTAPLYAVAPSIIPNSRCLDSVLFFPEPVPSAVKPH